MTTTSDVLVIGAGPAGLTAAAEAIRHGLSVRIIDQNESRSVYSKALVLHSRSLEIFHDMGFADSVIESGQKFHALNIYTTGERLARIVFEELDWQDAIFPYWLSIPQNETERCLEEHLNELGGSVERCTELVSLEQFPDYVRVTLRHQGEAMENVDVPWVVACDGARSLTRGLLGLELQGTADDEVFILGDVSIDWDLPENEGNNILSPYGIVLIVPMPGQHRFRIIAHMPQLAMTDQPQITLEFLQDLVDKRTPFQMQLSDLTWSSVFSTKHFVVSEHRKGRVFMAGDAAHIHSPVGGQGLNSGIQDAYNLMWKLALLHHGQALLSLLDSYAAERHKTAQSLITKVGLATKMVTLKKPLAQGLRNLLAGFVLNTDLVRNRMGRGVAMLDIAYKESPTVTEDLSSSSTVEHVLSGLKQLFGNSAHEFDQGPSAGMRAPNVILPPEGAGLPTSLFDLYRGAHYTLLIFAGVGPGSPPLETLLEIGAAIRAAYQASIQPYIVVGEPPFHPRGQKHLIVDVDKNIHRVYGARKPALYLVRPDKHIAYRSQIVDQTRLMQYLDRILVRNPIHEKE